MSTSEFAISPIAEIKSSKKTWVSGHPRSGEEHQGFLILPEDAEFVLTALDKRLGTWSSRVSGKDVQYQIDSITYNNTQLFSIKISTPEVFIGTDEVIALAVC